MLVLGDVGEMRKEAVGADHADRVRARQAIQCGLELPARSFVLTAMKANGGLANALDHRENGFALLLANRVTEDSAEQADVVPQWNVLFRDFACVAARHRKWSKDSCNVLSYYRPDSLPQQRGGVKPWARDEPDDGLCSARYTRKATDAIPMLGTCRPAVTSSCQARGASKARPWPATSVLLMRAMSIEGTTGAALRCWSSSASSR